MGAPNTAITASPIELLDDAAVLLDPAFDHRVVELEPAAEVLRVGAVGLRRELDEIDEQHGDELPFLVDRWHREFGPAAVTEQRPRRVSSPQRKQTANDSAVGGMAAFSRIDARVRLHR